MYAASLYKYFDPFREEEWYQFWGPIEVMVDNGRPLAIVCLAGLIILSFSLNSTISGLKVSPLMMPIHAIQVLIFVKLLVWGNDTVYTVQAGIIYVLVYLITATGLRTWTFEERTLRGPAIALATAATLFCLVVTWQSRLDTMPVFISGRLMGTTANPQHAAVFLALSLLGVCYLLVDSRSSAMLRFVLVIESLMHLNLLLQTGSRTGLVMSAIVLFLFFRRRVSGLYAIGLIMVGGVGFGLKQLGERVSDFTERGDTRTEVWVNQLQQFYQNPIFGRNYIGSRFTIGENSWLGLMEATGFMGLLVLIWLTSVVLKSLSNLTVASRMRNASLVDIDFCIAGLVGVIAGSFLEAYLAGIITMPVLFLAMLSVCCEKVTTQAQPTHPSSNSYVSPRMVKL